MSPIAVVLGAIVGIVLGLTGAGGSIFAVPLLMWGLHWTLPEAVPVALLAVSAAAAFGTVVAWDVTHIRYRAAFLISVSGMALAPLGLHVSRLLPAETLLALFALVLIVVATRLFLQARGAPGDAAFVRASLDREPDDKAMICKINPEAGRFVWTRACAAVIAGAGALTGFLSGLLGVGGGFVIVPALRAATQLSIHSAIATSLMAIALTSAGTLIMALWQGHEMPWGVALPFVLGSLAGMFAGRRLAIRIAGPKLQQAFAAMMLAVAAGFLVQAFADWRR